MCMGGGGGGSYTPAPIPPPPPPPPPPPAPVRTAEKVELAPSARKARSSGYRNRGRQALVIQNESSDLNIPS